MCEASCSSATPAQSMLCAMWQEHSAIFCPAWVLPFSCLHTGSPSEAPGCRRAITHWRVTLLFARLLFNLPFLFTCQEHWRRDTGREGLFSATLALISILNVLTHVSRMQGHSSTAWLQHPTPNKASTLWAACYSQCELPNGHNGGQDHLLLLWGGRSEVCIRLQLRRKTSRCL